MGESWGRASARMSISFPTFGAHEPVRRLDKIVLAAPLASALTLVVLKRICETGWPELREALALCDAPVVTEIALRRNPFFSVTALGFETSPWIPTYQWAELGCLLVIAIHSLLYGLGRVRERLGPPSYELVATATPVLLGAWLGAGLVRIWGVEEAMQELAGPYGSTKATLILTSFLAWAIGFRVSDSGHLDSAPSTSRR